MTGREAFRRAIQHDPTDPRAQRVFADWASEAGDLHGRLIHLQDRDPEGDEARGLQRVLLARILGDTVVEASWSGGFLRHVVLGDPSRIRVLLQASEAWLLRALVITDRPAAALHDLADAPPVGLVGLGLSGRFPQGGVPWDALSSLSLRALAVGPLTPASIVALAEAPVPPLAALGLSGRASAGSVRRLLAAPWARSLRAFAGELTPPIWHPMVLDAPCRDHLEYLDPGAGPLDPGAEDALTAALDSGRLPRLAWLARPDRLSAQGLEVAKRLGIGLVGPWGGSTPWDLLYRSWDDDDANSPGAVDEAGSVQPYGDDPAR